MTPNALNTFTTRIPVEAGDVIGYYHQGPTGGDKCVRNAPATYVTRFVNVDPAPGTTMAYGMVGALQVDLSAVLEPDADHDGYGDETQDKCPTDPSTQGPCATGQRAATLKKCKKKFRHNQTKRKKCRKKAKKLPI